MRTLYLHVGHDKTGTSYIQSASEGKISSGNGGIIGSNLEIYSDSMLNAQSILVSGEKLFRFVPEIDFSESFSAFLRFFNVSKVEILLFIREPLEHMSSSYQQAVKRGGYTGTIEEFADSYNHTKKVADFVRYCEGKNYNLKILNYSKNTTSILSRFEKWLNLEDGFLIQPKATNINRSLTFGELEFQLIANNILGGELPSYLPSFAKNYLR
jgi:hypothetical protein